MTTHKLHQKLLAIMLTIALLMGIPAISVFAQGENTLGESGVTLGASGKIITEFEPLAEEIRIQRGMNVNLPKKINGKVGNLSAEILVTWTIETDPATVGLHVYTAKPDDTYTIAEGVSLPTIAFMRVSLGRMAGVGTESNPLQITNAAQLAEIAALVNEGKLEEVVFGAGSTATVHLKLMNNIDLSAYKSGEGWVPIGTYNNRFNGNFDGGSKTVTNLYINRPTIPSQSLFGVIQTGGVVKNLGVVGCDITGNNYVGGVAGYVYGTLENCYATGAVSGTSYVGGVAGWVESTLSNCYATGAVSGTGNAVGGVAGIVNKSGTLTNSYATGSVSGTNYAGGVAGFVNGAVTNCYATGSVSGTSSVGGVAGIVDSSGKVTNCYALNPSVKGTDTYVGRVVGYEEGTLTNNYAFGGIINNAGNTTWTKDTHDGLDGLAKTAAELQVSTGFPSGFDTFPWTYEAGKLPGFGSAVPMPLHLLDTSVNPFAGGIGTSVDPYQIATPEQLAKLAALVNAGTAPYADLTAHYKLTDDIDLSKYNTNGGWIPIGRGPAYFKGNFDGGGFAIKNLTINRPNSNYQSLFGLVGDTANPGVTEIKNLGVVDCNIKGRAWTSGIVGNLEGAAIKNCYSTGVVSGNSRVSGIAGSVMGVNTAAPPGNPVKYKGGSLENCYTTITVSGTDTVGGVAGYLTMAGLITNCYTIGAVSGTNHVGGVVGQIGSLGKIENSAALNPSVKATGTNVGRVAGYKEGTLTNNYAFGGMINNAGNTTWGNIGATDLDGGAKTADEIAADGTLGSLFINNNNPWTTANGSLPGLNGSAVPMPLHLLPSTISPFVGTGTSADPYQIATAEQLAGLAALVNTGTTPYANANYKLTADIDLSAYKSGEGWVPIGKFMNDFKGNFDGNGKKITGLYIKSDILNYAGLFGLLGSGSEVKNLSVVGVDIKGKSGVGGVAGYVNGTVTNCYVTGAVSGAEQVGGVAGVVTGKIENCYSTGTVSGTTINVGGVVGTVNDGTVANCYATGAVSGADYVGGVAGNVIDSGIVSNCYATGTVSGNGRVGGVAGYGGTNTVVSNCYATSAVSGTSDVGGVVGDVWDGTVSNCAALNPSVKGTTNFRRVAGDNNAGSTLANNYAFSGMTGGGVDKNLNGKDGKDMNATQAVTAAFWTNSANWNTAAWSDTVWTLTDGKLPILAGLGGQDGESGLYLSQKDSEVLTLEADTSYVYTGGAIEPITAQFGTTVLVIVQDYTVAYTNNTNVGTATATAAFTGNYTGTKTATFAITKATPTGLTPIAAAINYSQTLADSAILDGTGAGTWAWADSTIVPTFGNSGYDAIFTPTDTANYKTVTKTIGITVNPTAPNAPTSVTATAGDENASVNFTPPSNDGGRVITGYTVTTNDGKTATGTASSITVTGLTNGVSYTFTVIATNSEGNSPASTPSNAVTPMAVIVTVTDVSVAPKASSLTIGKAVQLTAKTEPNNATFADVSWLSSDTAIATVDGYGKVTAVSAGTATITAKNNHSGLFDTATITVTSGGGITPPVIPPSTSGGSSSSSGGSNKADIAPVVGRVFAKTDAIKLFNAALATKPKGQTTLSIRAQNFTKADKAALVELATLAKKNGVTLTVHFDTVVGKAVTYRMSVNPATTQTNLDLTAKFVGGKITLPKFSPAVEVAVKMPVGITLENLKITQNGKDITKAAKPWLDKNGYLHFTTEFAGTIVFSDWALVRR